MSQFAVSRFSGEVWIRRPVDVVFDHVADERNEPGYNRRMLRAGKATPGPIGPGTSFTAVTTAAGRPVPMTVAITGYERPRRLSLAAHLPSMDVTGTLLFRPDEGGTRMRWIWTLRPRGILRPLTPLLALVGRRQERAIWTGLKRLLDAPYEVAPGVHCLAAGSGPGRSNVYFVRSGGSWVLIDTAWPGDAPAIRRAAELLHGPGARPAAILLTHSHPDHAGSARELSRGWKCPVYVHPDELVLTTNDSAAVRTFANPLDRWVILPLLGLLPRRRRQAVLRGGSLRDVVRPFTPGAGLPGLPDWELVHTPGHTPGHAAYFRRGDGILISGDALVTVDLNSPAGLLLGRPRLSGPPWYTTWNGALAQRSVRLLAGLRPRIVAGGHGAPLAAPARTAGRSPVQSARVGVT